MPTDDEFLAVVKDAQRLAKLYHQSLRDYTTAENAVRKADAALDLARTQLGNAKSRVVDAENRLCEMIAADSGNS